MTIRIARAAAAVVLSVLAVSACGSSGGGQAAEGPTRRSSTRWARPRCPNRAKRVIVLDTDKLDSLASLGLAPVGATTGGREPDLAEIPGTRA